MPVIAEERRGLPKNTLKEAGDLAGRNKAKVSDQLLEKSRTDTDTALRDLESRFSGLRGAEVEACPSHRISETSEPFC
jgi:hypothetical protein